MWVSLVFTVKLPDNSRDYSFWGFVERISLPDFGKKMDLPSWNTNRIDNKKELMILIC